MATYRQDAAPPGGYKDIEWARYYGKRPNVKIAFVTLNMVLSIYILDGKIGTNWIDDLNASKVPEVMQNSGLKILGVILAMKGLGFTWFYFARKKFQLEQYEEADWRISLMPFYLAETDRQRMKQFRSLRDHEAELMKDKADWKVGTWKGMELYHNQQNKFNENVYTEHKVFSEEQPLNSRLMYWLFSSSKKVEQ